MPNERLRLALEELYSFVDLEKVIAGANATTQADIARFRCALSEIGDPQNRFPSVLIAGSKGKGSTAALLEAIFRAAGLKTGLYTSPHLVEARERIRIAGECIEGDSFAEKLELLTKLARDKSAEKCYRTVFEILTAAAFEAFANEKVDIAVVEVGVGGRLDATNVINPIITAICPIGLDHTNILGDSIDCIAREKAGILRRGVPLVLGRQSHEAREAILAQAKELGKIEVLEIGKDIVAENICLTREKSSFDARSSLGKIERLNLHLLGRFQVENALVAVAIAQRSRRSGFDIPDDAIRMGLSQARWSARMQLVRKSPDIIIDGAHSVMAFERLAESLRELWRETPPVWIFAANKDKNIRGMLEIAARRSSGIVLTTFSWPRAAKTDHLLDFVPKSISHIAVAKDIAEAIPTARSIAGENGLIVVAGSLYLAGEALVAIEENPCEKSIYPDC